MNSERKTVSLERGREAVKAALVNAACEMLAEVGPNAMSLRTVANRAGVNHGQVHHYFGGKQGLIEAAAVRMAGEHFARVQQRSAGAPVPPPLTLGEDAQYLRAKVRLVLDGYLETASRELAEGPSVPLEARRYLTRRYPAGQVPMEIKTRVAVTSAIEMGWAALEPFILRLADVQDDEVEAVRDQARVLARSFVRELEQGTEPGERV